MVLKYACFHILKGIPKFEPWNASGTALPQLDRGPTIKIICVFDIFEIPPKSKIAALKTVCGYLNSLKKSY